MARARNIKPAFFQNELLVEMSFEHRLLFIGLWTLADREGRLENRPKRIKMSLFPADNMDVVGGLSVLEKDGFLKMYSVDGLDVIQIENFIKHQTPHGLEKDSELPDQDGYCTVWERKSNKCATSKFELIKRTETVAEKPSNSEVNNSKHLNDDVENNSQQLDNSYETVSTLDRNALNPESFNLNPLIKSKHKAREEFSPKLEKLNDMLKASGSQPVDQDKLDQTLVTFNPHYEQHELTENQRLAKLVTWLKRDDMNQKPRARASPSRPLMDFDSILLQQNTMRDITPVEGLIRHEA